MSITTILAPALLPPVADGIRALIGKLTGSAGAQPQNVDEAIRLMEAQTKRVQALAELDKLPDGAAQWVLNLRGSFRYIVSGGLVAAAVSGTWAKLDPVFLGMLYELAGSSMTFIIGEKVWLSITGVKR